MKYAKICTLFERDNRTKTKGKVLEDKIRKEEYNLLTKWLVTEKIHGTNIRIIFKKHTPKDGTPIVTSVQIKGRTDKANIPIFLGEYLVDAFPLSLLEKVFEDIDCATVTCYGEGYGVGKNKHGQPTKINDGDKYRKEGCAFRLFDVLINGLWLEWENVEDIAKKLGIKTVPVLFHNEDITFIVRFVKYPATSLVAIQESGKAYTTYKMEGVVCRTVPLLLDRRGDRVMFKLKESDFKSYPEKDKENALL